MIKTNVTRSQHANTNTNRDTMKRKRILKQSSLLILIIIAIQEKKKKNFETVIFVGTQKTLNT